MVAAPVRRNLPGGAVADGDVLDLLVGRELDGELIAGRGLQLHHLVGVVIDASERADRRFRPAAAPAPRGGAAASASASTAMAASQLDLRLRGPRRLRPVCAGVAGRLLHRRLDDRRLTGVGRRRSGSGGSASASRR